MPPPPASGSFDLLFMPQRGTRVRRASQVSRRTRQREIASYQQAFPEATHQQAARRTAAMRRRGHIPRAVQAERATPEQATRAQQYRQRSQRAQRAQWSERGGVPAGVDTSPQRAYEAMFNKIGPGTEAAGMLQRTVISVPQGYYPVENPPPELEIPRDRAVFFNPQTNTYLIEPSPSEVYYPDWNSQIVMANVSAMTDEERYWTIYEADAEAIRMRARIASKGDDYSANYPRYVLWFYHSDYWQGAMAA
jgi:hypothetical protein